MSGLHKDLGSKTLLDDFLMLYVRVEDGRYYGKVVNVTQDQEFICGSFATPEEAEREINNHLRKCYGWKGGVS